jgi:serine protease Do
MRRYVFIAVSGLLIFILAMMPSCILQSPTTSTTTFTTTVTSLVQQDGQPALPNISQVVTRVRPAVVAIDVTMVVYDFFGRPYRASGAGSGWIIDSSGHIVTNNHVVDGATSISVTLQDGRVFDASNVNGDAVSDLAVIKIDATGLPTLSLGKSSTLSVGDWAVAMGNSLGMGISATAGVVSALNVSLEDETGNEQQGLIQTDAAINPGNSGGPLVNMAGEVVGINSAKIAEVGVEGMGYAISIDSAVPVVQNLMSGI